MIKLTNTTGATLTASGTIPLNVAFNSNDKLTFSNNSVIINKPGFYNINGMFTLTSATTGDYSVQVYANGTAIPGAIATGTIATASDFITLTINDAERVIGASSGNATLSFVSSGAVSLTNANVSIVEVK